MSKTTKPDCEFQLKKYKEGQIPSTVCQYKETEGIYYIECDYEQEEEECPIKKLLEENQRLKDQLEQATKSTVNSHKYASNMENKVIELESKLKQRDEVIDEINNIVNSIRSTHIFEFMENSADYKEILFEYDEKIRKILQRYKGDNK